jgi:glycosyltransferase involved in cell wall biosynthesis
MKTHVQVVQHLRPGGIETMALDLLANGQTDEKRLIVSLEGNQRQAIEAWPRLAAFRESLLFLDKQPGLQPAVIRRLVRLFRRHSVDVVHTHHIGTLLYAGIASRLVPGIRLVHTEHDAWHLDDRRRCRLERQLVRFTRPVLIADSGTVADNMRDKLGIARPNIIPNGINTDRFTPGDRLEARKALALPLHATLIGCSGRLELVKGQQVLLDAFSLLDQDYHLVLAGSGSMEQSLRHQATRLGVAHRVHFTGHLEEMPTFYRALDLYCQPSLNEGLPLAPLEAQSCNIPAVVTDVGGSRETLSPESGTLVRANDPQELARVLKTSLAGGRKREPRPFIRGSYDTEAMIASYQRLYAGAA